MNYLLRPKIFQTAQAAILCGADAVYIGAERFSARQAAGNSLETIRQVVELAHLYYVRVYVALNTLLTDEELAVAEAMIRQFYDIGVDGLIVQDAGLLELDLPPIPLIASTQMNNATVEKVRFLEAVGFSRAILARELTLEQIRRNSARYIDRAGMFCSRGAVCGGQRAMHHELCAGRTQREPGTVCPAVPAVIQPEGFAGRCDCQGPVSVVTEGFEFVRASGIAD